MSKNTYVYPLRIERSVAKKEGSRLAMGIPADEVYEYGPFVCARSPQSHIGPFRWAKDFLVPDGTQVVAACDGKVVEIEESSSLWGDQPSFRDALNYVTIEHENGEFSQYCHLAKNSVSASGIQRYSKVRCGQKIAVVGKSGWTDRDHLHFVVFLWENPSEFKSVQVDFRKIGMMQRMKALFHTWSLIGEG